MNNKFLNIFSLFLLLFLYETALLGQDVLFSKAMVEADARKLEQALAEAHPVGAGLTQAEAWPRYRDSLLNALPNSISAAQANLFFRALAAQINCIHTYARTPIPIDGLLPFAVEGFADGWMITRSEHISIPVGSQLLAINGVAWAELLPQLRQFVASDSPDPGFRDFLVGRNLGTYLRHWLGWRGPLQLRLRTPQGVLVEARPIPWAPPGKIRPIPAPVRRYAIDTLFRLSQGNFWVDTLYPQAAHLQLRGFSSKHYRPFYRQIMAYLAQHSIQHLIIDLRNNPGGNIFHAFHLISQLSPAPFSYQLERRPFAARQHFNFGNRLLINFLQGRYTLPGPYRKSRQDGRKVYTRSFKPAIPPAFTGKIWVLTNAYCASSGSLVASYLQHRANAVVVGSVTGGGAWANNGGSFPKLILPQTRIKINFPLYALHYQLGPVAAAGVVPDFPVAISRADWLARRDPAMAQVYRLIQQNVKENLD